MKTFTTIILIFILLFSTQTEVKVSLEDLKCLDQTEWTGELMYVNYSDGREVTLQTLMQIEIKENDIIMYTQFVDEPSANSKSRVKLKKNGTYFGTEKIISKTTTKDGTTTLVTSYDGKDNNKSATIYKKYMFNEKTFTITTEVLYEDASKKFIRNKYTYNKL